MTLLSKEDEDTNDETEDFSGVVLPISGSSCPLPCGEPKKDRSSSLRDAFCAFSGPRVHTIKGLLSYTQSMIDWARWFYRLEKVYYQSLFVYLHNLKSLESPSIVLRDSFGSCVKTESISRGVGSTGVG